MRAPSTDPYQTLRWVPVPVGPLTKTRPVGSTPMSGSPAAWIGSTTVGTLNPMGGAAPDAVTDGSTASRAVTAAVATSPTAIRSLRIGAPPQLTPADAPTVTAATYPFSDVGTRSAISPPSAAV